MIPTTTREKTLVLFWLFVMAASVACSLMANRVPYASPMAAVFIVGALFLGITLCVMGPPAEQVDVWDYQRDVMSRSGQRLPISPEINHASVLYLGLVMEELGETATTMHRFLLAQTSPSNVRWHHGQVVQQLGEIGANLTTVAGQLRRNLAVISPSDLQYQLPMGTAVALLDDVSDLMVTASGLGLAAGLPNRGGYVEVQSSNLSKANPSTGVIDKHPDGKWIKGVSYREPNLGRVLSKQYQDCVTHAE